MTKGTIEGKKALLAKYEAVLEKTGDREQAREKVFEDFLIQVKKATRLLVGLSARRIKVQEAIRIWDAFVTLVYQKHKHPIRQDVDSAAIMDVCPQAFRD